MTTKEIVTPEPSSPEHEAEAAAVERLARKPRVDNIEGHPVLFVPHGYAVHVKDDLLYVPTRAIGTTTLADADSFIAMVNRYKQDTCVIYCDAKFVSGQVAFTALFNDHRRRTAGDTEPGWRDHRAQYGVTQSEEWKRWSGANGNQMPQAKFASFLEDNLKDVVSVDGSPAGSEMLAMALDFEATKDSSFQSSIRLQSGGVQLTYVDRDNADTIKRMEVFERFVLGIAPFLSGTPYELSARLRYRQDSGKVVLWFELIRPDIIVRDATKDLVERVRNETGALVVYGTP